MQACGALTIELFRGARVKSTNGVIEPIINDPSLYQKLSDEVESYNLYLGKKHYAEKMKMRDYEKMSTESLMIKE